MKKLFPFVLMAIALTGFGCSTTVLPKTVETKSPVVVTSKIPQGWETNTDALHGFAISYPGKKTSDVAGDQIDLPPAIGNKERKISFEMGSGDTGLDQDGCTAPALDPNVKKVITINNIPFCMWSTDDGAAGSFYRTYSYTTKTNSTIVSILFQIRYPTSVRTYAGCETDADQSKQLCIDLAFDETRDTQLFQDVMETFHLVNGK